MSSAAGAHVIPMYRNRRTTMNLPPTTIATAFRALAIALTVIVFAAGSFPAAGHAFPGIMHWIAHLAAYALIACAYALGWHKQPALLVAGFVAALGALHECTEIFTHAHALEIADIVVNSIGAAIGVAPARALSRIRTLRRCVWRTCVPRPSLGRWLLT